MYYMACQQTTSSVQDDYDYIVVGAGSAGCVVAGRLLEKNAGSVLLLESGDAAEDHPETLTADGFKHAFSNDALMFHRMSTPQTQCLNRRLYAGSGQVSGGSGSVNGMVYTRGDQHDFAGWPQAWSWSDCEDSFAAVENRLHPRPRSGTSFSERCITAAQQSGFQRKDGLNDGELTAQAGYNDINYSANHRNSSYRCYVKIQDQSHLTQIHQTQVQRIILDSNKRACAVEAKICGHLKRFTARKEIVLCAGALETPKLLMLSGIGPAAHLTDIGINTIVDAPGVGENLQDHPNVCLFYRSKADVDFQYPQIYGFDRVSPKTDAKNGPDSCYVFYAAPASIKQSMQRMLPILALPNALYQWAWLRNAIRRLIDGVFAIPALQRYISRVFGIVVILGKPQSRGRLRLHSKDPDAPVLIDLAYYQHPQDRETMLAAINKAKEIADAPAFREVGIKALSAGAKHGTTEKVWQWACKATMTTFHYCGSCGMGDDENSPVDSQLRVKGVTGLRVADASVIPEIPVSALNAPSMMIAHRAVNFILTPTRATA